MEGWVNLERWIAATLNIPIIFYDGCKMRNTNFTMTKHRFWVKYFRNRKTEDSRNWIDRVWQKNVFRFKSRWFFREFKQVGVWCFWHAIFMQIRLKINWNSFKNIPLSSFINSHILCVITMSRNNFFYLILFVLKRSTQVQYNEWFGTQSDS